MHGIVSFMMFILSLIAVALRCVHGTNYRENVFYINKITGAIPINIWYTTPMILDVYGKQSFIQAIYGRNNANRNNWEVWLISNNAFKFYMKMPVSGFLRYGQDPTKEYFYCDLNI